MAATKFSARFSPGLGSVEKRLDLFGPRVIAVVHKGMRRMAELMADQLKGSTPRSDGLTLGDGVVFSGPSQDPIADGWAVQDVAIPDINFAVEVFNKNPRANAEIDVSGGVTTLLHILEFGSRPHKITAKPGGVLRFFWPAVGDIVTAKSVEHPGTRPHAFMLDATETALERGSALLAAAKKVVEATARDFK